MLLRVDRHSVPIFLTSKMLLCLSCHGRRRILARSRFALGLRRKGEVRIWHISTDHILIGDGRFRCEAEMPRGARGVSIRSSLTHSDHERAGFCRGCREF